MKNIVLAFVLPVILLISCISLSGASNNKESERIYYDSEIVKMIWETMGGGDIKFEIIKIDNYFQIRVTRYDFKEINKTILLTSENKNVYDLVHNIFDKKIDVCDETFIPDGPTGTWTSITLIYSENKKVTIDNINGRLLHILYSFVHNNISSAYGAEVAGYPTKKGIYENNGWKYVYLIFYKETKSETRIGILYHNGKKIEKETGTILNTPVGTFLSYGNTRWNQGWLNTLTYDRRVFDKKGKLTVEVQKYIKSFKQKK